MSIPIISIDRKQSQFYEWFVTAGVKLQRSEFGQQDLAACLQSSVTNLPDGAELAEVVYRDIHMGTFLVNDLANDPDRVAKLISDKYAALTNTRVVVLC